MGPGDEAGPIWQAPGWDVQAIIDRAEVIDGLPFVRLEDVWAFERP